MPNYPLHANPARTLCLHAGRRWRRVGELRRCGMRSLVTLNLMKPFLVFLVAASGCVHHTPGQLAARSTRNYSDPLCVRPSGFCPEMSHGLKCALLPSDSREIWDGRWQATDVPPGDYQTQEVRNLVREGWWLLRSSTLPNGSMVGSV